MKKMVFFASAFLLISGCATHPELQKASAQAKKGKCQTDQLGSLLALDSKKIGNTPPKNIRFTGDGASKIKGRTKDVPAKGRITLGVNKKGEIISAYCG